MMKNPTKEKIFGDFIGEQEQSYSIMCSGRNKNREEVLSDPIEVRLTLTSKNGHIKSRAECKYGAGKNKETCLANFKTVTECGGCPYSFDIGFGYGRHTL